MTGADAVVRQALQAASNGQSPQLAELMQTNGELTVMDVGTAALMGDTYSAELLSKCGRLIGNALASLTNSLNPSLIVVGGTLAQCSDILLASIREAIYRRSHPLVSRDLAYREIADGCVVGSCRTGAISIRRSVFFHCPTALDRAGVARA